MLIKQLGMGSAVETLCGQAYGAGKYEMLGIYLQRSTILLTMVAFLLTLLYIFSKPILLFLGESPEIASSAAIFVYGLIPQIFAYAINFPIQKFLQSQSVVLPSAYISAATLVVHLSLSWVAAYKLGLGLFGASSVLSLSWWIIVMAQFVYILKSERFKETWRGFSSAAFSGLPEFFKLSAASAIMLCLETWYFQILVLVAGLLENPELSLNSLSIWYFFSFLSLHSSIFISFTIPLLYFIWTKIFISLLKWYDIILYRKKLEVWMLMVWHCFHSTTINALAFMISVGFNAAARLSSPISSLIFKKQKSTNKRY